MASISGTVTTAGDPDDWMACAFNADTHAFAGVAAVTAGEYTITGLTAGTAYVVACRPKTGGVWTAARDTIVGDYVVPTATTEAPYIFKATAAAEDANYTNVGLLLSGEGTNNSTNIVDSSGSPKTVSVVGNSAISTAQYKYGSSALHFDGNGDYLSLSGNAAWAFGTGDFTVECLVYSATAPGGPEENDMMLFGSLALTPFVCFFLDRTMLTPAAFFGGTALMASSGISAATWTHLAWTRHNSTFRIFIDGVKQHESANTINFTDSTHAITVGGTNGYQRFFNGYMQDLRVTKGIARYTDDFSVPSALLPRSRYAKTAATEPDWDITPGNAVTDGHFISWTNMGRMVRPLMQGPLISA